jgi:hypothetical protein
LLNAGNDGALLRLMRDETMLLVLMVRVRNQRAQDKYKERQAEQERFETALGSPLFEEVEK